jgi:methylated-DNA-[protein]-cysteine S-methyltransferase
VETLFINEFKSDIGKLQILSLEKGLVRIAFSTSEAKEVIKKRYKEHKVSCDNKINKNTIKWLESYFKKEAVGIKIPKKKVLEIKIPEKKAVEIEIPMFLHGTEFQQKVWLELMKIPYGEAISYKELARRVGLKQGFQAVGGANGKNPIPIIIPCHRVIMSDGSLGGFRGGLKIKKYLLELEGYSLI